MAIEGPLRELGVHDVFQLLDLTRKTGSLRVRSALRDNDGVVQFLNGRVVGASMRDASHQLGHMLVQAGRITDEELSRALAIQARDDIPRRLDEVLLAMKAIPPRELDRQVRRQIEAVVFELLSWSEGYFSFEEGMLEGAWRTRQGHDCRSAVDGSRATHHEWARMADRTHADVVPGLSDAESDHAAMLDLRPHEWQVLAAIDGNTSLRSIAAAVGLNEFETARIVYGLLSTGVVAIVGSPVAPLEEDALIHLSDAREATRDGRLADAVAASERAIRQAPGIAEAHALAGLALFALNQLDEAEGCLQRALELEPRADWMMAAARLAIRRGDLGAATRHWKGVVATHPRSRIAAQARAALEQAMRLHEMAEWIMDADHSAWRTIARHPFSRPCRWSMPCAPGTDEARRAEGLEWQTTGGVTTRWRACRRRR
jgi:tetratricopeptide (TPR) repeat protein